MKWKAGTLGKLILSTLMVTGVVFAFGCSAQEDLSESNGETKSGVGFITPRQALTLIEENENNPDFVIIDNQVTPAFDSGHIANAISTPHGPDFANRLDKLDKNKIYLVYCPTGCGKTSDIMKQLGFREVYELEGGIQAWISQGFQIEK